MLESRGVLSDPSQTIKQLYKQGEKKKHKIIIWNLKDNSGGRETTK